PKLFGPEPFVLRPDLPIVLPRPPRVPAADRAAGEPAAAGEAPGWLARLARLFRRRPAPVRRAPVAAAPPPPPPLPPPHEPAHARRAGRRHHPGRGGRRARGGPGQAAAVERLAAAPSVPGAGTAQRRRAAADRPAGGVVAGAGHPLRRLEQARRRQRLLAER